MFKFVIAISGLLLTANSAFAGYNCQNSKNKVDVEIAARAEDSKAVVTNYNDLRGARTFTLDAVRVASAETVYNFVDGRDKADLYVKESGAAYLRLSRHFETPVLLACVAN